MFDFDTSKAELILMLIVFTSLVFGAIVMSKGE
jgi:hypothetical protein